MAVTAGRTWDANTVTTTPTAAFVSDKGKAIYAPTATPNGSNFKGVSFIVDPASASILYVNIPAIHGAAYFPVPIGATRDFVCVTDGDARSPLGDFIQVKTLSGIATFSGGIVA